MAEGAWVRVKEEADYGSSSCEDVVEESASCEPAKEPVGGYCPVCWVWLKDYSSLATHQAKSQRCWRWRSQGQARKKQCGRCHAWITPTADAMRQHQRSKKCTDRAKRAKVEQLAPRKRPLPPPPLPPQRPRLEEPSEILEKDKPPVTLNPVSLPLDSERSQQKLFNLFTAITAFLDPM